MWFPHLLPITYIRQKLNNRRVIYTKVTETLTTNEGIRIGILNNIMKLYIMYIY